MKHIISSILAFLMFIGVSIAQTSTFEKAISSVVTVTVEKSQPIGKVLMGFRGTISEDAYERSLKLTGALGSGSGFVIKREGKFYVVTNAHVVESASDDPGSIYVYSYTRKKYEMKLVGGDSFYDVAVLEFVDQPGAELDYMDFSQEMPEIAEKVFAIGNPLGEYPYTVTDGIVSAMNRVRGGTTGKFGYIQSTATVIWGNSGGPLINEAGEVVGINSQIGFAQGPDGNTYLQQQLNFSLEPLLSNRIVNEILEKGKVSRSYFGLELAQEYYIEFDYYSYSSYIGDSKDKLPVVSGVIPGSPADGKANAYIGKAVTKINGEKVNNLEEALGEMENIKPGAALTLTFTDGKTVSLNGKELSEDGLESIAKFALEQHEGTELDDNSAQVQINVVNEWGEETNYYVLGGGTIEDYYEDVWRVTSKADLGALLKIYGLSGAVDYWVTFDPYDEEGTQKITHHYSKNGSLLKTVLWY